ncbi:MAG: hypothetical protein ABIR96_01105 [Bdellovibrionota bacterium]
MSKTLATLTFTPQADGLVAGLASRAHQWSSWDMLQISRYDVEWSETGPLRIVQSAGRTELRIFGTEALSLFSASFSSQVSASQILSQLLLERRSLARPTFLSHVAPPHYDLSQIDFGSSKLMKIQTLDRERLFEDPWEAPLSRWIEIFPEKPSRIEDLRYRNSMGFLGQLISQTLP